MQTLRFDQYVTALNGEIRRVDLACKEGTGWKKRSQHEMCKVQTFYQSADSIIKYDLQADP